MSWIRSWIGDGASYEHIPIPMLSAPMSSIPPVTGIQYFRCFFENGLARSFTRRVATRGVYHTATV